MTRAPAKWAALAVFLLVAAAVPLGERWWKCRLPVSEGCVWAKALWPVTLTVGCVVGLLAAGLAWALVRAWADSRRSRDGHRDGDG